MRKPLTPAEWREIGDSFADGRQDAGLCLAVMLRGPIADQERLRPFDPEGYDAGAYYWPCRAAFLTGRAVIDPAPQEEADQLRAFVCYLIAAMVEAGDA